MMVPATCQEGTRVYRHGFCNSSLTLWMFIAEAMCWMLDLAPQDSASAICAARDALSLTNDLATFFRDSAKRTGVLDYKGYMLFKFRCETTSTESNALDNSCPCSECSHTTLRSHCCCTRPACRRARINWLQSCRLLELESGNHHVELIKVQTLVLFQIV